MGITMAEPPPRARPDDSTGGSHVTIRPRWAALAALPVLLTACGSGDQGSSPTGTTTQAPTAATANLLELCRPGESVDKDAFVAAVQQTGDKASRFRVDGTMSVPTGGTTTSGTVSGEFDTSETTNPRMKLDLAAAGGAIEMLMVDHSVYLKMPSLGGKYMKAPLSDAEREQFTDINIAQSIEKGRQSIQDVRCIGRETVDGVETGHYRYTMAAPAALPTATGTPTAGSSPTTTGQSVAVELWAGADNLPVKSSTNAAGYPGEFRFSRWGEPVTITAPDPSQVEELSGAEPRSTR